ncbi:NfeD family protein [Peribacillus sp. SCS-155]|uniref:NfeD family protein n=1 Tax=Peribacillus sedimenti TaxID=3115297 RepID=UPI003905CA54
MEIFGAPLEQVYLYGLVISGILTLLFILFNDAFAGLEAPDFLNPTLIVSFLTILSASGYLFERLTGIHSGLISAASAAIALLVVSMLNIFVLIPLSSAEESLVITEYDLKGRTGVVITSVPIDGFGEVLIESNSGSIAKPAVSFNKEAIPSQSKVLIIDVENGVLHVSPYKPILEIS